MPRDATATRERLLGEAERLFAERGIDRATSQDITAAAGQRNASALTYHFGSREQLLGQILLRHGEPMDLDRGKLAGELVEEQSTRDLVLALVVPYAGSLLTASGRRYVRIVAQLTDRFPVWNRVGRLNPPNLRAILGELGARTPVGGAIASERLVAVIMLMTITIAERARLLDQADPVALDHEQFVTNLADMLVAIVEA
jgi:TetR/AcrR family transcriptional regulator, regulator of cefoperazone and chloramphenicol sensitivity